MEPLLIAYDLDSCGSTGLVIPTLNDLTERPFPQDPDHLVSIAKVVTLNDKIVTPLIVITVIVTHTTGLKGSGDPGRRSVKDLIEIEDFFPLKVRHGCQFSADES